MKFWNIVMWIICMARYAKGMQSQQPLGYIGCYEKGTFGKNILTSVTRLNNGTYCIRFCERFGYRYAGTQGVHCKCGRSIRSDSKQTSCTYVCAGAKDELCGGLKSMTVYDIKFPISQTTTPKTAWMIPTYTKNELTKQTTLDEIKPSAATVPATEKNYVSTGQFDQDKDRVECMSTEMYLSIQAGVIVVVTVAAGAIFCIWRKRRLKHDTDAKHKLNETSQSNTRSHTVDTDDDYLNASLHGNLPSPAAQNNDNGHLSENDDDYLNASLQGNLPSPPVPNDDNGHLSELLQSNIQSPNVANADNDVVNESLQSIRVVSSAVHEYVDINSDELVSQRVDDHCYSQLAT